MNDVQVLIKVENQEILSIHKMNCEHWAREISDGFREDFGGLLVPIP